MILDQFLATLSPEMWVFIKEHNLLTLKEAVKLEDNWATAHNAYPTLSVTSDKAKMNVQPKVPDAKESAPVRKKPSPNVKCYNCGEIGHIHLQYPQNPLAFKHSKNSATPIQRVGFCLDDSASPRFFSTGCRGLQPLYTSRPIYWQVISDWPQLPHVIIMQHI